MAVAIEGCSPAPIVADSDKAKAEAFLRSDQDLLNIRSVSVWHAGGLPAAVLCGEFDAPAALKAEQPTLRFYFDPSHRDGQVEYHRMWRGLDEVGQLAVEQNRMIFDQFWAENCRPYAPVGRRIAHLFGR